MKRSVGGEPELLELTAMVEVDGQEIPKGVKLVNLSSPNADTSITEWSFTLPPGLIPEQLMCVRIYDATGQRPMCGFNVPFPSALNEEWIPDCEYRDADRSFSDFRVLPQCTLTLPPTIIINDDDDSATNGSNQFPCINSDDGLQCYFVVERNAAVDGGWCIGCDEGFWIAHYGKHARVANSHEITLSDVYAPLPFYPPDHREGIEHYVPIYKRLQRRYHWFEMRANTPGRISGSTTTSLFGFFPARPADEPLDDDALLRMSRGRVHEIDVMLTVLHAWGSRLRCVEEVGTYVLRGHPNIHATPDALATFREGEIQAPAWARQMWEKTPISPLGIRYDEMPLERVILEYKVSFGDGKFRPTTKFSSYYLPQIYLELMATNSRSAFLVRYAPPLKRAYAYHIWRDPAVEVALLQLLSMTSQTGHAGIRDLQRTKDFKARCQRVADYYNHEHKYEFLKPPQNLIEQFHQWKQSLQHAPGAGPRLATNHRNQGIIAQLKELWKEADSIHELVGKATEVNDYQTLVDDDMDAYTKLMSLYARMQRLSFTL